MGENKSRKSEKEGEKLLTPNRHFGKIVQYGWKKIRKNESVERELKRLLGREILCKE